MTNFTNDEVLHNNLDKVVDELLDKPLTPTQRKKVLHLSDEGHFYIDKLEDVSSQLCNKLEKANDAAEEQRLHL